jgi:hypothetical protein
LRGQVDDPRALIAGEHLKRGAGFIKRNLQ